MAERIVMHVPRWHRPFAIAIQFDHDLTCFRSNDKSPDSSCCWDCENEEYILCNMNPPAARPRECVIGSTFPR